MPTDKKKNKAESTTKILDYLQEDVPNTPDAETEPDEEELGSMPKPKYPLGSGRRRK